MKTYEYNEGNHGTFCLYLSTKKKMERFLKRDRYFSYMKSRGCKVEAVPFSSLEKKDQKEYRTLCKCPKRHPPSKLFFVKIIGKSTYLGNDIMECIDREYDDQYLDASSRFSAFEKFTLKFVYFLLEMERYVLFEPQILKIVKKFAHFWFKDTDEIDETLHSMKKLENSI